MKLVYFLAGVALFITVLFIPNPMGEWDRIPIVESICAQVFAIRRRSNKIKMSRSITNIFQSFQTVDNKRIFATLL